MTVQAFQAPACAPDHEQKRAALGYLHEAWAEARLDGIDGDCLAQACLFTAFAEFVIDLWRGSRRPLCGRPRQAHPQRRILAAAGATIGKQFPTLATPAKSRFSPQ